MTIYVILVIWLLCMALSYKSVKMRLTTRQYGLGNHNCVDTQRLNSSDHVKTGTIIVLLVIFFIVAACRSITVGKDMLQYERVFLLRMQDSWTTVLKLKEPGFAVLTKALSMVTDDFQIVMAVYAAIILVGPMFLVWKYSINPYYSMFLYITMRFMAFSFSGIRSAIALSILIFAFDAIIQRKPVRFIITVLFASLFHVSALVFLISYPLAIRKLTKTTVNVHAILSLIVFVLRKPILRLATSIPVFEHYGYTITDTGAFTYAFVIACVFALVMVAGAGQLQEDNGMNTMCNMLLCAFTAQVVASASSNFSRITEMFYIYSIVLVPNTFRRMKDTRSRLIMYTLFTFLMLLQFFVVFGGGGYGTGDYSFFWENNY